MYICVKQAVQFNGTLYIIEIFFSVYFKSKFLNKGCVNVNRLTLKGVTHQYDMYHAWVW